MNCKPGDLALIVRSTAGNEGKVVTCLRFVGDVRGFQSADYWLIDRMLNTRLGGEVPYVSDSFLRPIRPGDISDEEVRDLYLPKLLESA